MLYLLHANPIAVDVLGEDKQHYKFFRHNSLNPRKISTNLLTLFKFTEEKFHWSFGIGCKMLIHFPEIVLISSLLL